jgi:hypothetical protein
MSSREAIDYGYLNREPLNVDLTTFVDTYAHGINPNDLELPIIQNRWKLALDEPTIDHARFLDNYGHFLDSREVLEDPVTENRVSTYWANQDQLRTNPEKLTAIITTWTSSMETNGGNRREFAVAAAMSPETPFVIIDNPGSGFSDKLPSKVMEHTLATGEFDKAGAIISRALAAENHYPRVYMGTSTGGRYALGIGRSSAVDNVERLGVIDPPGQSAFGARKLGRRMVKELVRHAPKFAAASEDPYLRPHDNFDTPEEWEEMVGPKTLGAQLHRNRAITQKFWQLPRAMAKQEGLSTDIASAMSRLSEAKLTYVSPNNSELVRGSTWQNAADYLARLAIFNDVEGDFIERVKVIHVPEATHYFTSAYPTKVGALTKEIIK